MNLLWLTTLFFSSVWSVTPRSNYIPVESDNMRHAKKIWKSNMPSPDLKKFNNWLSVLKRVTPLDLSENHFPQMEKAWSSVEATQQWLICQICSKRASMIHPGGWKHLQLHRLQMWKWHWTKTASMWEFQGQKQPLNKKPQTSNIVVIRKTPRTQTNLSELLCLITSCEKLTKISRIRTSPQSP